MTDREPFSNPTGRNRHAVARRLLREASLELARLRRIRGAYRRTWRRIAAARVRLACAAALLATPLAAPADALPPLFRHGFVFSPEIEKNGYTRGCSVVDIDGDGDLDAFLGQYGGNFVENRGTPTATAFPAAARDPFRVYGSPALVDIDGDGDLDAFFGLYLGDSLFFENTGTATAPAFGAPSSNPFGLTDVGGGPADPAFADIDADGDFDAFFGEFTGNTLFFRNTGTASAPAFAAPSTNPFGLADVGFVSAPAFADIDGDGDLDALVGQFSTSVFFENTGTASTPAFGAPAANAFGITNPPSAFYLSPSFADVDGDGDFDLLLAASGVNYDRTTAFENTGTATAPAFTSTGNRFGLRAGRERDSYPTLGDLDGDGDLDALLGTHVNTLGYFENTGTKTAPVFVRTRSAAGLHFFDAADLADIDGDGDLDVFADGGYAVFFFANTGTASTPAFAASVANPFGMVASGDPDLADVDGDGDLDAFVGHRNGTTTFFRNTGTASAPAFAAPETNPFGLVDVGFYASPDLADVDGDGDGDAFVGTGAGDTLLFENSGTASAPAFAAPVTNPMGLVDVGLRASPELADIDGDGDLDALVGEYYDRVFFFENVALGPGTCSDGLDNDGDGRIDFRGDPGCASGSDPNELSSRQCDNGLDDDGDGEIDWRGDATGDPHCVSLKDKREAPPPPGLGHRPQVPAPRGAASPARRVP